MPEPHDLCPDCGRPITYITDVNYRRHPCEVETYTTTGEDGRQYVGRLFHPPRCPGKDRTRNAVKAGVPVVRTGNLRPATLPFGDAGSDGPYTRGA